jgi:hypothetical protein
MYVQYGYLYLILARPKLTVNDEVRGLLSLVKGKIKCKTIIFAQKSYALLYFSARPPYILKNRFLFPSHS